MINQFTVDVSAALDELMTKEVPATIEAVGADKTPCVPPGVLAERKILDEAVTAVVETVTVPAVMATEVPIEAFAPVAIESLLPAVPSTTLPFVAVILPKVAVIDVPALTAPAVATIFPVVEVIPVPAVTVVVAARDVVVVNEPGVVIADGRETVATPEEVVTVTWLAVPTTLSTGPSESESCSHVADVTPAELDIWFNSQLPLPGHIHLLPIGYKISVVVGALTSR